MKPIRQAAPLDPTVEDPPPASGWAHGRAFLTPAAAAERRLGSLAGAGGRSTRQARRRERLPHRRSTVDGHGAGPGTTTLCRRRCRPRWGRRCWLARTGS